MPGLYEEINKAVSNREKADLCVTALKFVQVQQDETVSDAE